MVTEGPLTAAQIYEQVTGGKGTQSLSAAHDSATQLTSRMVERAQRINALRTKTMAGWQGQAGDSASDATLPLVQAATDDAVHLENARTAVGAQMHAFGTVKNSVKPVAPQPPEITSDDLLHALSGQGFGSYNTKVAGWQADSQGNIDAFRAYHSASSTYGGQMPAQYAQLSDSGSPISMTTPGDGTHGKNTGTTDTGQWARNPRQPQVPVQQTRRPGQSPTQSQNQYQYQNQNQTSDATHANSYVPQPVMPPAAQGGYEFGPTGNSFGGNNGYGTGGYHGGGFGPGTGGYGTGGNTGGYSTGYRPGSGPGTGTGTGTGTGSGYRRPGPGAGTGSGYRPETGARGPGASTGARLPEERLPGGAAARGGAPGARGANGMPMGSAGGGRGGKEEDKEKKAAGYLRNPNPDETFGGFIEKPMPPVIGENRGKK
jgi:hypothetical protein